MKLDLMLLLDLGLLSAAAAMYFVDQGRARAGDPQAAAFASRWLVLGVIAAAFIVYRLWR